MTIKMTYFNIAGVAEKVRLAFVLGGVQFEDHRIKFDEWAAMKPTTPYGQLPVLTTDKGASIAQSDAMLRYAATLTPALAPGAKMLEIDELLGLVGDFTRAWLPMIYLGMRPENYGYPPEFKGSEAQTALVKAMREKWIAEELPRFCAYFEAWLDKSGGPFLCGSDVTIADCALVPELRKYSAGFIDHVPTDCMEKYPKLTAYINAFLAIPAVKAYYDAKK